MSVRDTVRQAEALLPGEPAPDDQPDPRWQCIIAIGQYIETEPQAIWEFIRTWGSFPHEDLRTAIATCLLEHLLEYHFTEYFPQVEHLSTSNSLFADTFLMCSQFGQSKVPVNAARFTRLKRLLQKRHTAP